MGTAIGNDDTKDKRFCSRTVLWAAKAPPGMDFDMYCYVPNHKAYLPSASRQSHHISQKAHMR